MNDISFLVYFIKDSRHSNKKYDELHMLSCSIGSIDFVKNSLYNDTRTWVYIDDWI